MCVRVKSTTRNIPENAVHYNDSDTPEVRRSTDDRDDRGERQPLVRHQQSQIRVLYVDDASGIVETNRRYLERHDERIDLAVARSAAEGMERLADETFDCIISDYAMPGTNGIEFCETVREAHTEPPFILYTSKPCDAVITEALATGVTDYVQKERQTAHLELLADKIVTAVESRRTRRMRNRLLEAIECLEDGIALLDEDGQFIYVNDTYAGHVGTDPAELVGDSLERVYEGMSDRGEELLHADDTARATITLQTAGSCGEHVLVRAAAGLVCAVRQDRTEQTKNE